MHPHLDEFDFKIINLLQKNAKMAYKELSIEINKSISVVHNRIKKLEALGYIKYIVVLDLPKFNKSLSSFTEITLSSHSLENLTSFHKTVKEIPEAISCYATSGSYDFLLEIIAADTREYYNCIMNKLSGIKSISTIHTNFVLDELKNDNIIDLSTLIKNPSSKLW